MGKNKNKNKNMNDLNVMTAVITKKKYLVHTRWDEKGRQGPGTGDNAKNPLP